MDDPAGVDLSPLHRELDRLKAQLCRCDHQNECLACRGFEMLRQQSQMVVAAASQPVLMQVAQEAALKDMMNQIGGMGERLSGDARLQDLMAQIAERVQEDLGGPDEVRRWLQRMGLGAMAGMGDSPVPPDDREIPPDDRPHRGAPPEDSGGTPPAPGTSPPG